jgi:hypothetical protein
MMARFRCLIATCSLLVACGGRYLSGPAGDDGDGATSHGGSDSSRAGKASGGAGQGGQGGTNPLGGAVSATGGGTECPCDPIGCPPGYEAVPTPTSCCPQCQVTLGTCDMQREEHRMFSGQVLVTYGTISCQTSADCSVYYETNACSSSCGHPLAAAVIAEVDALLDRHAQATCDAACPPIPVPPCPETVVVCKDNRCTSP